MALPITVSNHLQSKALCSCARFLASILAEALTL
jgi:hypothetical protein